MSEAKPEQPADDDIDEHFRRSFLTLAASPIGVGAQRRLIAEWRRAIDAQRRVQMTATVLRAVRFMLPCSYLALAANVVALVLNLRDGKWIPCVATLPVLGVIGISVWLMRTVRRHL